MVDGFLVQSNSAAATLQLEGIDANRIIKFSPYSFPLKESNIVDKKEKAKEILGLDAKDIVIGHTGNLEWEEDLFDLIHGAKIAMDKNAKLAKHLMLVFL